jgi:hypothetical protein
MATLTRESRVWRIRGLLHRRVGVSLWRPDGGVVVLSAETAGSALSAFTHCGRSRAVSRRELRGSRLAAGCADPAGAFAPDTTDYGWIARITSFAAWMMVGGVARQRPLVNPWPGLEPGQQPGVERGSGEWSEHALAAILDGVAGAGTHAEETPSASPCSSTPSLLGVAGGVSPLSRFDANTDHSRPPLISRHEAEPETPLVAWWTRARSRLPCS